MRRVSVIARHDWRIALEIWDEARFSPMGFIHLQCSADYFGTADVIGRIERFTPELTETDVREIASVLEGK